MLLRPVLVLLAVLGRLAFPVLRRSAFLDRLVVLANCVAWAPVWLQIRIIHFACLTKVAGELESLQAAISSRPPQSIGAR